jgi:hypothetical protein
MHLCIRCLDFASIYEFSMMVIVYCTIYVTVYPIEFRSDQAKDYKIGIWVRMVEIQNSGLYVN